MVKKMEQNGRIYFLCFSYTIGGGDAFFLRIIEYLLKKKNIKIGIIDFNDGIVKRTAQKLFGHYDIDYINYEDIFWNLDNNSCIVVSYDRIGTIAKVQGKNVKILTIGWEDKIGWNCLFPKKELRKLSRLLKETNSFVFLDYGVKIAIEEQLHQHFENNYLPLYYFNEMVSTKSHKEITDTIRLTYLGRLSELKVISLMNVIENFYQYKTSKKKIFNIIGDGSEKDRLKEITQNFSDKIEFTFTNALYGQELTDYIKANTDVGISVGTSMFHFAGLGIPVIASHEYNKPFSDDKYLWLYDLKDYCLGTPIDNREKFAMCSHLQTFESMLNDISLHNKKREYGLKCLEYYKNNHNNLEKTTSLLLDYISHSSLTYEKLKKILKFMPYTGQNGILIKTIYIWTIPVLKIIYHVNEVLFYFLGLKMAKLKEDHSRFRFYLFL